jgi:hypothetical protein
LRRRQFEAGDRDPLLPRFDRDPLDQAARPAGAAEGGRVAVAPAGILTESQDNLVGQRRAQGMERELRMHRRNFVNSSLAYRSK